MIFRNRGWSKCGDYGAKDYYEKDPVTKEEVDFIIGDELKSIGDKGHSTHLYNELIGKRLVYYSKRTHLCRLCRLECIARQDFSRQIVRLRSIAETFESDRKRFCTWSIGGRIV